MMLREWAAQWGVSLHAIIDLEQRVGLHHVPLAEPQAETDEGGVQSAVRLEAARAGVLLFRNNVGVLQDDTGRPVRYGLANDSKQVNAACKSADLIGIRPRVIVAADVGNTIGQFTSREVKHPGWHYTGTPREVAQLAWANLIIAKGGDACFASGPGTII